jgi:hypothetical protein
MTTPTQPRSWRSLIGGWIALTSLLLLAVSVPPAAHALGAETTARTRHWSAYREPADVATIAPADVELIYETALRFYRPPRNQFRRLEVRILPTISGDTTTRTLSRTLAALLVARLGDRFCLSPDACRQELGAELRVSSIYASSPDRVRVIVGCRMVWPGDVSTDNGAQAFEIVRAAKGWRIADRGGVETPR